MDEEVEAKIAVVALALAANLVSPPHSLILFERGKGIFGVDPDARDAKPQCLTESFEGRSRCPVWSPDRERWAFIEAKPGASRIWMQLRRGGGLLVGTCPDTAQDLAWGGDDFLYHTFTAFARNGTVQTIRKLGAFTGRTEDLLSGGAESHPSWSRGRLIWSQGRQGMSWQIWTASDRGTEPRLLIEGNCADPIWSPDGRRIAYASNQSGNWEIYVADAASHSFNRLTASPKGGYARHPAWSPDGLRIAYETNVRPENRQLTSSSGLAWCPAGGGKGNWIVDDAANPAW